ncbi:unnamed protein product [Hyaloperonospora brassicae]|uniref:SCP domain-containing protein n=1 Tax=Hyaloperonospora brassicae TaxID=162125 RepID=A0AAV0TLU3_HYABA|nr:unnamed protein product [Hyaloperonospora brassicae]
MLTFSKSSLTLLLAVATVTDVSAAANLRRLEGTTIATNKLTYASYNEYAKAMLDAVNHQRATQGLPALCLNQKLHVSSQRHSNDMATHDFMDHFGTDGSRMSQRITDAGYEWESVAENVAVGHVDVADVMVGWINSPEHLENIMGDYTMFGSAYAFNLAGKNQHYWTQNFGTGETEACDRSMDTASIPAVKQEVQTTMEAVQAPVSVQVPDVYAPAPVPTLEVPVVETPEIVTPEIATPEVNAPVANSPVELAAKSPKAIDCESTFDVFSR